MASNFYEIKARWENGSVSKNGPKNSPALKDESENSSILKNRSCAFTKQVLPSNTTYISQLLLSRGLDNKPVESKKQENGSQNRVVKKNVRQVENVSEAIWEVENDCQGFRKVANASPVFSRVGSLEYGEDSVNVSHELDKEEIKCSLERDPEEGSGNDLPVANDLMEEVPEPEMALERKSRSSEFCDSFSEHLRELESSLKFDSPEKWLFTSMEKRNSGASVTSFEEFNPCQSDEEDEKSDDFVIQYESDSSLEAEHHGGETVLPKSKLSELNKDKLSELNKLYYEHLVNSPGLEKFSFAESSSSKEEIEEKMTDDFSDSVSSDLPFIKDLSGNLLKLIPSVLCRSSSSSCGPSLSKKIHKSTRFKMAAEITAAKRVGDSKIVITHRRTSSLVIPLSSVEVSKMIDSSQMTDFTSASQRSKTSWSASSSQMVNSMQMASSVQITESMPVTDLMQMRNSVEVEVPRERKSISRERKMFKMAVQRDRVVQEILDTEVTYQTHLALIIKFFERPLREMNILSDHVVVTIFGNVEQLMAVNTELLIHVKSLSIGEAFHRLGPFLKLYSTYANNHERALAALMEWDQKSPEFARFRRTQEELPEMRGLKLNALLITPVQRIPRYKLLLEELLANTLPGHKDYANIEEAVKQISAVASHINEHIKQQDNFMKMLAIQRSLSGPVGPQVLVPGRIFIKEGPLRKVSKKGGRSRERMFYLFSDILMYAKPRLLDGAPGGSTFICCCILPLHHCKVDQVFGHSQGQGSLFTVQCKEESLVLFSDQKTVNSWISSLRSAIDDVQASRQSLRKTSSAKEPMRGGAIMQFLKREKKADLLVKKNSRPCDISKHKAKHQDKRPLVSIKSCLVEHENIHPNEKITSSTPKKHLRGLGCLRKRRQIFPDSSNFLFPKSPPRAEVVHSPNNHRSASDILRRIQSGTSPPSSTDRNGECKLAYSSIDSDVTELLSKRRHKSLKKPL